MHISEAWKDEQRKRLKLAELFQGDNYFQSIQYYDPSADFFRTDGEDQPKVEALLEKREWVYIELDEGELEAFSIPENRIDCYTLVIHADGTALYKAYGKYINEEFWTEEFSLHTLCMPLE